MNSALAPSSFTIPTECTSASTTTLSKRASRATSKRYRDSDNDSDYYDHDRVGGSNYPEEEDGAPKKKVGRKLATDTPISKRVAQNRVAQRAFRERREAHLRGLEDKIKELTAIIESRGLPLPSPPPQSASPSSEVHQLKRMVESLQQENAMLRQIAFGMGSTPVLCQSPVAIVKPEVMTMSPDALARLTPSTECGGPASFFGESVDFSMLPFVTGPSPIVGNFDLFAELLGV
ncbi:hypothetical protein BC830DRAFT_394778 [Chytriomyces sp. MP71]|nr:hypothetical protein BC830DRAFT_394778 [Chytriomyces sp. MP71]